jgi:IS30 family transposase
MWVGGRRPVSAGVREVFWQARAEGVVIAEAAVSAGVSYGAAVQWIAQAGGVRPRRPVVPSGRFLSLAEREEIAVGLAARLSCREIARRLGRPACTVSREIARNQLTGGRYRAVAADRMAQLRASRPKVAKLAADGELREWVQDRLTQRWSPAEISATLAVEFPDRPEMRVSHETIYQSIYVQGRGALRRELASCLRTGRAMRRPKRRGDERRPGQIKDMIMISDRPAEVEDRAVPGHWEGDLIIGKDSRSAIGTLVERSTRFCLLLHLPTNHGAEAVRDAMLATITTLPAHLRRTMTWDQGKEMARHAEISLATGMDIYFCDPHSPWQRGSNENTNGLLRQYFPKGTSLSRHSRDHLDFVAAQLNGRPRKTLQWQIPTEALNKLLLQ